VKARRLAVLGSTGSIGVNALEVVRRLNREGRGPRRTVWGLSAHRNLDLLKAQIREFRPKAVTVMDEDVLRALNEWARRAAPGLKTWLGEPGLVRMAADPSADFLLSSVVGAVGLRPLHAAIKAGKTVALANKEALIVAGSLLMAAARRHKAVVLPVDSEHSAMFQCLPIPSATGERMKGLRRLVLTASGGAFYRHEGSLDAVTPAQALNHPTWKMGKKITVDCATLTNKGLEAIEAHHLFGVPLDDIKIVIHPQSIVHSLVEFDDGSMLAQLSHPDMRVPIQYALTHPERHPTPVKPLALDEIQRLDFRAPDFRRFPCLDIALTAGKRGGLAPAVFNGANEAAVKAFLDHKLSFTGIPRLLAAVMKSWRGPAGAAYGLDDVLAADRWARQKAQEIVESGSTGRRQKPVAA
jgi:1-deoxy-D-xylulose-5-phosphate reductoisomerase